MKAEEAAEKVEISLGTLYAYERGTRPIPSDKLKLFADVYGGLLLMHSWSPAWMRRNENDASELGICKTWCRFSERIAE